MQQVVPQQTLPSYIEKVEALFQEVKQVFDSDGLEHASAKNLFDQLHEAMLRTVSLSELQRDHEDLIFFGKTRALYDRLPIMDLLAQVVELHQTGWWAAQPQQHTAVTEYINYLMKELPGWEPLSPRAPPGDKMCKVIMALKQLLPTPIQVKLSQIIKQLASLPTLVDSMFLVSAAQGDPPGDRKFLDAAQKNDEDSKFDEQQQAVFQELKTTHETIMFWNDVAQEEKSELFGYFDRLSQIFPALVGLQRSVCQRSAVLAEPSKIGAVYEVLDVLRTANHHPWWCNDEQVSNLVEKGMALYALMPTPALPNLHSSQQKKIKHSKKVAVQPLSDEVEAPDAAQNTAASEQKYKKIVQIDPIVKCEQQLHDWNPSTLPLKSCLRPTLFGNPGHATAERVNNKRSKPSSPGEEEIRAVKVQKTHNPPP